MLIEPDNVCFNKAAIIERALVRMREEYLKDTNLTNYTYIDAMVLNLQRACQASIDLANHIVAVKHLGIPQSSKDAFLLMEKSGFLSKNIVKSMTAMTGFRNIAIHEYQEINQDILKVIAEREYVSLVNFCSELGLKIVIEEM